MWPLSGSWLGFDQSTTEEAAHAATAGTNEVSGEKREGIQCAETGKGCDIGYALATSSCEEANSVDACTVAALDAITAFTVPNPNFSSQISRFFQVWLRFGLPRFADHSAYFGLANFIKPTLSAVDVTHLK